MTESQKTDLSYARGQLVRAKRYAGDGRAADCVQRALDALDRIVAELERADAPCTNRADGILCDCPVCEDAERDNQAEAARREPRWVGPAGEDAESDILLRLAQDRDDDHVDH